MLKSGRITTIDVMRGIGIIAVVIQHVFVRTLPDTFQDYLNFNIGSSFNMALFLSIAGYLTYDSLQKHTNHQAWLKTKAYYLLVPHFGINILIYPFSMLGIAEWTDLSQVSSFPQWILNTVYYSHGEWYLWVMFVLLAVMIGVHWVKQKYPEYYFPILLIGTLLIVCLPYNFSDALWIHRIQFYLPFTLGGYLLAEYRQTFIRYLNFKFFVPFCVLMLGIYTYFLYLSDWNGGWGSTPFVNIFMDARWTLLRFGQGITAIPPIMLLAYGISKVPHLSKWFSWLGRITLGVYLGDLIFTKTGFGEGWILVWTSVVMCLIISIIVTLLARKYIFNHINKYFIPARAT